jgi:UDP-glucose 4-epimerase
MDNLRQGMVSIYLEQLLKNDHIVVKGSLERFRDFIYIEDCVDVVIGLINDSKSHGKTYNIGTGVRTTVSELLDCLQGISGIHTKVNIAEGTPGDQKGIFADISLARKEIGFNPKISITEGLKRMIAWAQTL